MKCFYEYGVSAATMAVVASHGLTLEIIENKNAENTIPHNDVKVMRFDARDLASNIGGSQKICSRSAKQDSVKKLVNNIIHDRVGALRLAVALGDNQGSINVPYYDIGVGCVKLTTKESRDTNWLNLKGALYIDRKVFFRHFEIDCPSKVTNDMLDTFAGWAESKAEYLTGLANNQHVTVTVYAKSNHQNRLRSELNLMIDLNDTQKINKTIKKMASSIADRLEYQSDTSIVFALDKQLFTDGPDMLADSFTVRSYIVSQIRHALGFNLVLGHASLDDDYKLTARVLHDSIPHASVLINNAPDDMVRQMNIHYKDAHSSLSILHANINTLLDYVDGVHLSKTIWHESAICF